MVMFKPLLAGRAPTDLSQLRFPVLVSPKLDGIRCVVLDGRALTRSLKPIPNAFVRGLLEAECPDGIDGELIVDGSFNATSAALMARAGEPSFTLVAFDLVDVERPTEPYVERLKRLTAWTQRRGNRARCVSLVPTTEVATAEAVLAAETQALVDGYEGLMIRDPLGPYKFGRSTTTEGTLLKLKRFEHSEAEVLGYVALQRNANELTRDELGRAKRSTARNGLVTQDLLGTLRVRDLKTGVEFSVGAGFTAAERLELWAVRHQLIGRLVRYKHQPYGAVERPRLPIFTGFRDPRDLS